MATTVGLLHPGEMGAVVGACLRTVARRASCGPQQTAATTAGAQATGDGPRGLGRLAAEVTATGDGDLSVCSNDSRTVDVTQQIAAAGLPPGSFVDANASPGGPRTREDDVVHAAAAGPGRQRPHRPPARRQAGSDAPVSVRSARRGVRRGSSLGAAFEAVGAPRRGRGGLGSSRMAYAGAGRTARARLLITVRTVTISHRIDETLCSESAALPQPGLKSTLGVRRTRPTRRRPGSYVGEIEVIARDIHPRTGFRPGFAEAYAADLRPAYSATTRTPRPRCNDQPSSQPRSGGRKLHRLVRDRIQSGGFVVVPVGPERWMPKSRSPKSPRPGQDAL